MVPTKLDVGTKLILSKVKTFLIKNKIFRNFSLQNHLFNASFLLNSMRNSQLPYLIDLLPI